MGKVHTGYHGTSEIEHGLCAYTVDNPRALAREIISPYRRTKHALSFTLSPLSKVKTVNCIIKKSGVCQNFIFDHCYRQIYFGTVRGQFYLFRLIQPI